MKTLLRLSVSSILAVGVFFAGVLGIEYATWFHAGPADPLADPALNAIRFGLAGAMGLAAGLAVWPRRRKAIG